ncbi:MAG: DNA translocase FtsK [Planctomycetes bacterium]|nr:DNA translocase FtsK [Planctomycetota bacterium]MCP4839479.1 DNA translocase FtsK [Planctomycetota bacterium]
MATSATVGTRGRSRQQRSGSRPGADSQPRPLPWVGWIIAVGVWSFLVLSLISFSADDPPSHTVSVWSDPIANLGGRVGAWTAYWSLHLLGVGAWLIVLSLGCWLGLVAFGRRPGHPILRAAGLVIAAAGLSSLHAAVLPSVGGLAGAPGGLVGHATVAMLTPEFGAIGTTLLVLVLLTVGLIVMADEIMLAVPGWIWARTRSAKQPIAANLPRPSFAWIRRLGLRPEAGTAIAEPGELDEEEDWEYTDEVEDDYEEEDEDEDEEEEEEYEDDPEVEDEYEEDEYEEIEDEESDEEPRRRLSKKELKAKISRLPIRMFGGHKDVAKDEDIQRENYEGYEFPSVELLAEPETDFSERAEKMVREQAESLESALNTYEIDAEVTGIDSGPTVTLYSVQLAPGTRVARINSIASDLARSLGAPNIRIVPTMAGKTTIGIEVPNTTREKVRMKELISSGAAEGMVLPMFLGKDASGEPLVEDLVKMPHMLISGTTGSGKSVCINSIIMSWLFLKRPDEVKLILVDPKMVELSMFGDIPHLACPVITEMNRAAAILDWAVRKMEERYEIFREAGVRDIRSFNGLSEEEKRERFAPENDLQDAKIPKQLPYIVFIIDELADLMMTNKEVEQAIVRIAQKARAVGIHLILATQRPQANVVTGLIKSNMPFRMSFKVSSGMDSRIVLDAKGAELLLGQGDMMIVTPRNPEVRRAQGTLVDDGESRKVVRFLKDVASPSFERSLIQMRPGSDGEVGGQPTERDPMFDEAVRIMIESGRGSVSLLQRRLAIGYSRASRLVDQMGQAGILGEHKGSVAREVMISLEEWEQMAAIEASEGGSGETDEAVQGDDFKYEYEYDEDPDNLDGVPEEMPGEYKS